MDKCLRCDTKFNKKQKTQKFCSKNCKIEFNKYCDNICEECGITYIGVKGRKYCSSECRKKQSRETRSCKQCGDNFIVRVKHTKELCSDVCRVKWSNLPENRLKQQTNIRNTVLEKYGVDHVWKDRSIHKKTMVGRDRATSVEKQRNTVKNKTIKKLINDLKDNKLTLLNEYTNNKNTEYRFKCTNCSHVFGSTLLGCGIIPRCPKCHPTNRNSSIEFFITDFLDENGITYLKNDRKLIKPLEIDILIPEHNLAIEVNGLYWHGELNGKDKNYHLNKTKLCNESGVTLLQFTNEEIHNKPNIILSMLRYRLGLTTIKVYARKCNIKPIDSGEKSTFLNINHISGGKTKDSVRLGLYNNGLLVSVMSFSKRKITRGSVSWEISRFASKIDYVVVGGFSKLFKHFIKNYKPTKVVTYADLRWSNFNKGENVYHKNGFTYVSHTPPNYWYFYRSNNKQKFHRYTFRKDKLVTDGFDASKTEWEIMVGRGFDRLWDCGSLKYEYNLLG